MSGVALILNVAVLAVYGYSAYCMNAATVSDGMKSIVPAQLQVYGQLKFLTYQCLLIQILSTTLHILAHFVKPLRRPRDLVFTALAYPVGSIVVYSFWGVWFAMGRELILPSKMDAFFPPWLNHATHTIIAPVNILLAILMQHKYLKNGVLVTLIYFGGYVVFLHVIKAQTGLFVYGYLETFSDTERLIYFAATAVFAYLLYKSGQFITFAVYGGIEDKKSVASSKQQQQQKRKVK